jgi:peptidoglycan hydrolase CwlO-like protein
MKIERHTRKGIWKKILYSYFGFGASVVILVFLSVSMYRIYNDMYVPSREGRKQSENRLSELNEKEKNLTQEIDYLNSDLGKEGILREKFDARKPGEKVVVVVEKEKKEIPEDSENENFIKHIWNSVNGLFD